MKKKYNNYVFTGIILLIMFVVWTVLIQLVDVQCIGPNGTKVGFATLNGWFHRITGVHMTIYTITDWLGLVPVLVCMVFGGLGFVQLAKRKNILKVDSDILLLGIYYVVVIVGYLVFEMFPMNYRPILIEGRQEASYPSSTTLLVLSVMPTLIFQVKRRLNCVFLKKMIIVLTIIFSTGMVVGRMIAGVHWFTDIVGSVLLCSGLYCLYRAAVESTDK